MNDAWFILGIFALIFVLWLTTGGPTRPISFAGPYITPITTLGDIQVGYGDDTNGLSGISSPHENSVVLEATKASVGSNTRGFITIRSTDNEPVNISEWRLVSGSAEVTIAQGVVLAREGDVWHVFLGADSSLWHNNNATVYLLDREGRTVDTYRD